MKVLIVDDSALMRRQLAQIIEAAGFEVRLARNGQEAVDENLSWQPDVVTLDINMPVMDGITALSHMMVTRPVPVVMVSSLTEKGALATFEALALGAVDYIAKPSGTISISIEEIAEQLVNKVKVAARAKIKSPGRGLAEKLRAEREKPTKTVSVRRAPYAAQSEGLVIIGVSTGGPATLEEILPKLPADFPVPIIIAQHMPAGFTRSFAQRMNNICALEVVEVVKPMPVDPGFIYIGMGGTDVVVTNRSDRLTVLPRPESREHLWHPSVELLGRSVLEHCEAEHVIAVLLTGMGNDGADAFTKIKKKGGRTIAESEDSAVVFGMPKELIENNGATLVLPSSKIANQLMRWVCE